MIVNTHRPTIARVSLENLTHNLEVVKDLAAKSKVMAIVKANAYGHGLLSVAKHFESLNVDYLGVAYLEEGALLRKSGIKTPILVLGGIFDYQIKDFIENDLEITVSSHLKLKQVESAAKELNKQVAVHLKIDTGMNRVGVRPESAKSLIDQVLKSKHILFRGIYSHLACSEDIKHPMNTEQTQKFLQVVDYLKKQSPDFDFLTHLANSGGVLYHPDTHLDLVRPGAILYGVYPGTRDLAFGLKPAMSLKSKVVYSKDIVPGSTVSYGASWRTVKGTKLVTIPIGYGDGWRRDLSNQGRVLLKGQSFPVVGRVCMDNFMVDVGDKIISTGDEVVLIGSQEGENIYTEDIAALCQTDVREILCNLNQRIPRLYL